MNATVWSRRYILIVLLVLIGCTTIKPLTFESSVLEAPGKFSHVNFDRVLKQYVDKQGRINYRSLKQNPRDLEMYYYQLSLISPDSHPERFPSQEDRLTYWINAYNASVIKTVLAYYPISSVLDIKPPFPFFFLPKEAGFFVFKKMTYGGKMTNLYFLENNVIRKRFSDPRIHFALNCAARGCPQLPATVYTASALNEQLDQDARRFANSDQNFRIDHPQKTIYVSSIFKWYKKDFLEWYQLRYPGQETTILNYIGWYLSKEKAEELNQCEHTYTLEYIAYDWRLNDQNNSL